MLLGSHRHLSVQRTIQELFEVYSPMDDAGFPVKAEEFVVLSQEPSVSETIAPKSARPFIEVGTDRAPPLPLSQALLAPPGPFPQDTRPPCPVLLAAGPVVRRIRCCFFHF